MADQQKLAVKTIPTALVYSGAVIDDWEAVSDDLTEVPPKAAVGVLYAHYMIETGGLNCYNWNIGNVKHVTGDGYDYHCLNGVWEGVSAAEAARLISAGEAILDPNASHQGSCKPLTGVVFKPPHPATRFRVYANLSESMRDHLILLCKKRYANAWPAVLAGDVMAFAQALKDHGYMTSSAAAYGHGMQPSFSHYMASREYEQALAAFVAPGDEMPPPWPDDMPILHSMVEFEPIRYFEESPDTLQEPTAIPHDDQEP